MRHVRTLFICLLAVFALAALTAGVASAEKLPAWGQCVKTQSGTGGKYADPGCIQPVKKVNGSLPGAYEWYPQEVSPGVGQGEGRLQDRVPAEDQPVSQTTITLADGYTITCEPERETTEFEITGPHSTLAAPYLVFDGCRPTSPEVGVECGTTDRNEEAQITTWRENLDYALEAGPTWHGTLTYFEGKRSSDPVVGYVFKTSPKKERFLQQLVCEGGPVQAMLVGGHKGGEELAMQVNPVNAMSASHTLKMSQSGGIGQPASFEGHPAKPLEAQVNSGSWEPIGFETTIEFPETEDGPSNFVGEPRALYAEGQLELKATP